MKDRALFGCAVFAACALMRIGHLRGIDDYLVAAFLALIVVVAAIGILKNDKPAALKQHAGEGR